MAQKRPRSPSPTGQLPSQESEQQYFKSAPLTDRKSTFIAIFSPTVSSRDLQRHPDCSKADHKMVATRKASSQQTLGGPAGKRIMNTWSDDDGEKFAGKHLERVLNEFDVEGAVVVARWYGGVLLGPARFEHIKTVARDAIRHWKETLRVENEVMMVKKAKIEDEAIEKARLAKQLKARDESIVVLRKLLAGKVTPASESKDAPEMAGSQKTVSPAKHLNYEDMPLARLKQLDKARDATIAFILKQIDSAEGSSQEDVKGSKQAIGG